MIELTNVSKSFRLSRQQRRELNTKDTSITAVDNVSFTCQPGRIFSLLGPNGAGKTTTLRMISTILKPTGGTIKVAGHDVMEDGLAVRKAIGFLTGSTGLYQRMTPNELVAYFADLYGMDKQRFKQRKEALFTLLDMHGFANKRIAF